MKIPEEVYIYKIHKLVDQDYETREELIIFTFFWILKLLCI